MKREVACAAIESLSDHNNESAANNKWSKIGLFPSPDGLRVEQLRNFSFFKKNWERSKMIHLSLQSGTGLVSLEEFRAMVNRKQEVNAVQAGQELSQQPENILEIKWVQHNITG